LATKSKRSNATKVFEASGVAAEPDSFRGESEFMPDPPAWVLDIGCGGGDLACFLAPRTDLLIGLDLSLDVLQAVAKKKKASGSRQLHLVVADVNQLPFKDGSFDYVVSRYTLHHTELNESLPEVRRIIVPGGRLFLRDIFARWPSLERFALWQLVRTLIKTVLHIRGKGFRSGWRYLRFNLSAESFDHMLHQNRLVDGATYRELHQRWFPGCEFEQMRPRYVFWEAPVVKWRKPGGQV